MKTQTPKLASSIEELEKRIYNRNKWIAFLAGAWAGSIIGATFIIARLLILLE